MANSRRIAKKLDPQLWEKCKVLVCVKGGMCKHGAFKMLKVADCYKRHGGRYAGKKSSRNSMVRWLKEKWTTVDGSPSGGKKRFLPQKAWKALSKDQIRRTNLSKRRGYAKGKQFVRQPKDVAMVSKRFRRRS